MDTQKQLISTLRLYLTQYPSEADRQIKFSSFIESTQTNDLYRRDNFIGHITGSAFILNKSCTKILLLKHKSLGKWLQPGGHIDASDSSIQEGCIREIEEETGISKSQLDQIGIVGCNIPFDLDAHSIPANPNKGEKAHIHYDVRYCFKYLSDENIKIDKLESEGFKWVDLVDLVTDPIFGKIIVKLEQVL